MALGVLQDLGELCIQFKIEPVFHQSNLDALVKSRKVLFSVIPAPQIVRGRGDDFLQGYQS